MSAATDNGPTKRRNLLVLLPLGVFIALAALFLFGFTPAILRAFLRR